MLGVAWATLPDLPTYRTGVILVGLARCMSVIPFHLCLFSPDLTVGSGVVEQSDGDDLEHARPWRYGLLRDSGHHQVSFLGLAAYWGGMMD